MNGPLVSIIIPTYNRGHLISETLDSIQVQTYTHWECIVVDDGSSDNTREVLGRYLENDTRFRYLERTESYLPGGNGARNMGFDNSIGELIQYFDSDDLMTVDKLENKVSEFINGNCDVAISKTKYFNRPEEENSTYAFESGDINFESYAIGSVSWYTPDMMIRRSYAEQIRFNEEIKAGQEYNYCCKLLLLSPKISMVDAYSCLRRYTENSIGTNRRANKESYYESRFWTYWKNFQELKSIANNKAFNKHSIITCLFCYFWIYPSIVLPKNFSSEVIGSYGLKAIYYFLGRISLYISGKYHYFYRKLRESSY